MPFACAGRGPDLVPESASGAKRPVAESIEPPKSDESKSLDFYSPAEARVALWETDVLPPAEPA